MSKKKNPSDYVLILLIAAIVIGGLFFAGRGIYRFILTQPFRPFMSAYQDQNLKPESPGEDYVVGKVVVIDKDKPQVHGIHFRLPEELRASSPEEVGTVVWLSWGEKVVGTYTDGSKGYRRTCNVTIIDQANRQITGSRTFLGSNPPEEKSGFGRRKGDKPSAREIAAYIKSLDRVDGLIVNSSTEIPIPELAEPAPMAVEVDPIKDVEVEASDNQLEAVDQDAPEIVATETPIQPSPTPKATPTTALTETKVVQSGDLTAFNTSFSELKGHFEGWTGKPYTYESSWNGADIYFGQFETLAFSIYLYDFEKQAAGFSMTFAQYETVDVAAQEDFLSKVFDHFGVEDGEFQIRSSWPSSPGIQIKNNVVKTETGWLYLVFTYLEGYRSPNLFN